MRFQRLRWKDEDGQAIVLVAVSMGIFLLGGVGLAVDGAHLYSQRQMAQTAADSAAIAAMMSIYDGTNTSGTASFSTSGNITCTSSSTSTPCVYAANNGFGQSGDTVVVDFPSAATAGVSTGALSSDPVNLVRVTVTRTVNTTLMRFLGPTATDVKATATAAILSVVSPVPILVTDPYNAGSLYINGSNTIKICGGPTQSIQVNSASASAFNYTNTIHPNVDLSHAGPGDPGDCTSAAAGADFGITGGPGSDPGNVQLGTGTYRSPSSPIQDPLAGVAAPTDPGVAGTTKTISSPTDGCKYASCVEYSPGDFANLITSPAGPTNVIFKPGLYYVKGGGVDFSGTTGGQGSANSYNAMCSGCTADPQTGFGMTIYDTSDPAKPSSHATGGFQIGSGANFSIQGPTTTASDGNGHQVPASPYYGVLFWEDRSADTHSGSTPTNKGGEHSIGQGSGCFSLTGTIYITNTLAIMNADHTHFQHVTYNGTPCSTTINQGYIVVSQLELKGTTTLQMKLTPYGYLKVRQVALVN